MVSFPDPRDRPPFYMHDMIRGQPEFQRLEGDELVVSYENQ